MANIRPRPHGPQASTIIFTRIPKNRVNVPDFREFWVKIIVDVLGSMRSGSTIRHVKVKSCEESFLDHGNGFRGAVLNHFLFWDRG